MTSRKELAHLSGRSEPDAYTFIDWPRKTAKFESRPQARHWRSNKTVAEGERSSAIVENHSQLEIIAAGLRQLSESLEVASIHGSARLDFDTDQCATSRFDHKVNLVLIFVP